MDKKRYEFNKIILQCTYIDFSVCVSVNLKQIVQDTLYEIQKIIFAMEKKSECCFNVVILILKFIFRNAVYIVIIYFSSIRDSRN